MLAIVISLSLVLFATGINSLPNKFGSGEKEENGLVYVFNVYAVRNKKSETVGRMLKDGISGQAPSSFEPIGSILLADEDAEEPFTLDEFSEFLEDMGVTVEKLSDEEEHNVIEIKMDMSWEDFGDIFDFEELEKLLEAEGINIEIEVDGKGSTKTVQISFDESRKNSKDQPFTLKELAEFFEREGYDVDTMTSDGTIESIRIHVDKREDETSKQSEEQTTTQSIEKKVEKKVEKHEEKSWNKKDDRNDDRFSTLDFVTKSDSLNKIRKRRSACPECRTAHLIKDFVEKHSENL